MHWACDCHEDNHCLLGVVPSNCYNISADDALELMKSSRKKIWKEDWDFLENQRGSSTGHMSNIDQHSVAVEKRKRIRYDEENLRRSKINLK